MNNFRRNLSYIFLSAVVSTAIHATNIDNESDLCHEKLHGKEIVFEGGTYLTEKGEDVGHKLQEHAQYGFTHGRFQKLKRQTNAGKSLPRVKKSEFTIEDLPADHKMNQYLTANFKSTHCDKNFIYEVDDYSRITKGKKKRAFKGLQWQVKAVKLSQSMKEEGHTAPIVITTMAYLLHSEVAHDSCSVEEVEYRKIENLLNQTRGEHVVKFHYEPEFA